jgi:adenine-specific DNA methylase
METWNKLPLELMDEFAEREGYRRDVYRPIYSMHKWWARRPGSTFRILGLAALTDEDVTQEDILRENSSGSYEGLYLQDQGDKFEDATVLDPFAGGGTTLVETNRLGAQTIGYELNPVAWWTIKKSIDEVDLDLFKSEFEDLLSDVRDDIGHFFKTENPETGNECDILYSFLSQRIPCLSCDEDVSLFSRYTLAKKKANAPAAIYCPNDRCSDPVFELEREIKDEEKCPTCGHTFDPSEGNYGYGKYTCSNGHKHDIKETLQRLDEKPTFEYFAIQYESRRGNKRYKQPDADDLKNIEKVQNRIGEKDGLLYPQQSIPEGDKTQALLNYNYDEFHELFTDRQLLLFSKLFERAIEAENQNISEFLVTVVSNALNFASTLCRWHIGNQKGLDVFERHAYAPKIQPVEPNPLNDAGTLSSLENAFGRVYDAKEYCERPFEKVKENGSVNQYYIQGESISEDRLLDLKSSTSEHIDLSDAGVDSVDYVITDPPYYDNVQYSELSDFFYIWLRECLKDEYEEFKPELVPKAREIVANSKAGKDEEFFINGLTNVFSESYRVLDEDGEMIFTYHHNENEAWSVILRAIIESGFTVAGAYPVQSERSNSTHISDLDNAEYDILLFCNKEEANEEITLSELRDDLYFEIQEMIEEERERHENLSPADLGVVLRGKCMYYYSKHYPEVYSEGEQVSVGQALDTVDSVIEQVVDSTVDLPPSLDQLSREYAGLVNRGQESYDELNKTLMSKGLNVTDLEDERLVTGPREEKRPVSEDDRIEFIEGKLDNGEPENNDKLLDIDKVHYLAHLYRTEQNTMEYLKAWKSDKLEELADFVADATGDETYSQVMEMNLMQF